MAWVYILRGASGRHYIGSTGDLERRLAEHQRGGNHTTHRFGNDLELIASARVNFNCRSADPRNPTKTQKESAHRHCRTYIPESK
jgi:predicted GIY-YIG superfamily endonuclease